MLFCHFLTKRATKIISFTCAPTWSTAAIRSNIYRYAYIPHFSVIIISTPQSIKKRRLRIRRNLHIYEIGTPDICCSNLYISKRIMILIYSAAFIFPAGGRNLSSAAPDNYTNSFICQLLIRNLFR